MLNDESVFFLFSLLSQALLHTIIRDIPVILNEIGYHVDELVTDLKQLLLGELTHDLWAIYPLHPPTKALAQGAKAEPHGRDYLQSVDVSLFLDLL